jgi:hypothetical protein
LQIYFSYFMFCKNLYFYPTATLEVYELNRVKI